VKLEVDAGPLLSRLIAGLEQELSPPMFRHAIRQALLNAALRYSDRLGIDRRLEVDALEELAEQLKAGK